MAATRLFDAYLMVDWSAASRPKRGRDSIWVALRKGTFVRLCNPPTRAAAFQICREMLLGCAQDGLRLLAGFDFSFAFPSGTAGAVGVADRRELWAKLAEDVVDDEDNVNNRFSVAAEWNRTMTGGPAPFWGCPAHHASRHLSRTKPSAAALPELRVCERRARARSSWQLFYNGSVGSQALLGIPWLGRLQCVAGQAYASRVWPFDTGFQPPAGAGVTFVEVYPSLLPVQPAPSEVKDSAQVRTLAAHFEQLDKEGHLAVLFGPPSGLSPSELEVARQEEGWILGVR